MTKILLIGDPHIRHTHLSEGKALLEWIEKVTEEHKPDLIVNLGDTFNDHSVIRAEVMCTVSRHLDRLLENNIPVIMVLGNHDMHRPNSSEYHALEVFDSKKNLTVADVVTVADGITYVPYIHEAKDWPKTSTDIIITHNTFIGADYGFKMASDGLSTEQLDCNFVASGHIHKKQVLEYGSLRTGRILYPGTPMCLSASDADQVKGLTILNTDDLSQTFIKSPFPMWRTLDFKVGFDSSININSTDMWIVKVIGPRAEVKALLESKEIVDLKKSAHVTFKTEFTDASKTSRVSISAPTIETMTDQYIDKVYSGSIDKDDLKSTIRHYTGINR
jgi:DNA repair exonuclease SbcCD nuclease subunit